MKLRAINHARGLIFVISACAVISILVAAPGRAVGGGPRGAKPLLKVLPLFTAPNVPEMGPAEIEATPLKDVEAVPPGLPGKGMAQHPMLYVGEGYNKILLVNKGKIIWTYSTGPGWEYDDVWMLSNGNILFSRMQYVAEVTPDKRVVWQFKAPPGTEIHTC